MATSLSFKTIPQNFCPKESLSLLSVLDDGAIEEIFLRSKEPHTFKCCRLICTRFNQIFLQETLWEKLFRQNFPLYAEPRSTTYYDAYKTYHLKCVEARKARQTTMPGFQYG